MLHLKQIALPVSVLSAYTTTLIRNSGYSSSNAALLNIPNGFVGIIAAVIVGYSVRHTSYRWAVPGILGGGLMSFLPVDNHAGLIAGIYIISTITPTLLLIYQWTASNIAGHAKGVVSMAPIAGSFSVGSIVGPQTFQGKDAPGYLPAKITLMATQVAGTVFAFCLFGYYVWANVQKTCSGRWTEWIFRRAPLGEFD